MIRIALLAIAGFAPFVQAATVFVNVNVISMTSESVQPARTVVVENGVIVEVGPVDTVKVPPDSTVVDGTDRFLIPGLGEMHAHVPAVGTTSLDRVLTLFAANGVTTIRGMLGRAAHLDLKKDLQQERVFGPRLITSGPSLNGTSVSGVADARRHVVEQHAAGYDFLKIHPGLNRDEFMAIAEAANDLGIPFAGHVPVAVGVEDALSSGMASIDHLDGYIAAMLPPDSVGAGGYGGFFGVFLAELVDENRLTELVDATAGSNTWNVPTETLVEQRINAQPVDELRGRADMRYMPEDVVANWASSKQSLLNERGFDPQVAQRAIELRRELIVRLFRANGRILLGSDAPQVFNVPGFSTHYELESYVAAGLTPFEALQTGTTAVAEFLGINTGTIESGKDADLVLLNDNPLVDIRNTRRVHGVMLRGRWYSRQNLDTRLQPFRYDDD